MTDKSSISHNIMSEPENNREQKAFISVVTPAFNEAKNLPMLYPDLRSVLDKISKDWEWIVVDDHSTDETFDVLTYLAAQDDRLRGFRLSRNSGSHLAIACGLNHAVGDCAVVMAADLQDPPDTLPDLVREWNNGAQIVWASRARHEGAGKGSLILSRIYRWMMRHLIGIKEMPASGADYFLVDRKVLDAFRSFNEININVVAMLTWMGFRQATISYTKKARTYGKSSWSLGRKVKIVIDSVMSFSYLPIRLMSYSGLVIAFLGFAYAVVVIVNAIKGNIVEGWASLMVVILLFSGTQMLMMGILGEYLWRTLSEARNRPRYTIEAFIGKHKKYRTVADENPSDEMRMSA